MALTYDIGGVPTKAGASSTLISQAQWLKGMHDQADLYRRQYAQSLATDQNKTDAGIDITTYPTDAYRLDTMGAIMAAVVTLLEGGTPGTVPDTRDFCAQIIPLG